MVNTFLSTFLLASVTIASPAPAAPAGHAYKAPGPNDVRSPCPGLNSLANHGFIHRNGKGMTIPHLIKGGKEGMNIGADFMIAIGGAGDLSNPNPLEGNFDLDHLKEHDFPIEHDGSLSRSDKYFSRNNWFDLKEKPYNQWMSVFGDAKKTSIKTASNARYTRISDSLKRNPNVSYGPREFILSYGETGLYLQTMGMSTTSGVARLDYVESLFKDERLPYEMGWSPPANAVTLGTLAAMALRLNAANKEMIPEGLHLITEGAFEDAFSARDPVTHKLLNATGELTGGLLGGGR